MTENRQTLNRNLAQMLKGGVIMDVTTHLSRLASLKQLVHVQLWHSSVSPQTSVLLVAYLV